MSFSNSKRESNSGVSISARNAVPHLGRRNKGVNYTSSPINKYPLRSTSARSQSKGDVTINKSVLTTPRGRSGISTPKNKNPMTPKNNPMVNRALINLATSKSPVAARSARA